MMQNFDSVKISVAMATYNGGRYLRKQLESLANQSVKPYELVVCDDGSSDSTVNIIRDFSFTAPFPVNLYINEVNLGYADNFLKAAKLCHGDWIAFCDQDDVWLPNKLERVISVIEKYKKNKLVLIGHTSLLANENLELTGQRLPDFKHDAYIKRGSQFGFFCIVGFSMICSVNLVRDIDFSCRPRMYQQQVGKPPGHDQWIGMLANAIGNSAFICEPLAIWRRHADSLTNPSKPSSFLSDARVASSALNSDSYKLLGNMAEESSESFRLLMKSTHDTEIKRHLESSALDFQRLAKNLFNRSELYDANSHSKRIKALAQLIKSNAYFGRRFSSLGFRSFLKDIALILRIIGK